MKLSLATCLLVLCGLLAATSTACAASVATGEHERAALEGQFVFYVGGPRSRLTGDETEVKRFDIQSGLTQTVFPIPTGWGVDKLAYRGGRLVLLLIAGPDNLGSTSRLVSMDAGGGTQIELASVTAVQGPGNNCFRWLYLAAVTENGDAIVNQQMNTSFDGSECAAMKISGTVRAYAADGFVSELIASTSEWFSGTGEGLGIGFPEFVWGASDRWLLTAGMIGSEERLVVRDRYTGISLPTRFDRLPSDFHAWPNGGALLAFEDDAGNPNGIAYVLPAITQRHAIRLKRRNSDSDFHSCGDFVLEKYARASTHTPARRARLALRDHSGKVVRSIHQRIPADSEIIDCDGNTALVQRNAEHPPMPRSDPPSTVPPEGAPSTPGTPVGGLTPPPASAAKRRLKPAMLFTVPLG